MKKLLLGAILFYLLLISTNILCQPSPICDYPFCGSAYDVSGNNFHGTVNGAVLVDDRFGNPLSAYKFDGVNDRIIVTHDSLFDFNYNQNFSISVWALAGANQANVFGNQRNQIIEKYYDAGSNSFGFPYSIRINNQTTSRSGRVSVFRKARAAGCNNRPEALSDSLINDSIWHHIVMIRQDSAINLWIDGNLDTTVIDFTSCSTNNNFNLYFGSKGASGNAAYFKGLIDDIKIYDYDISAAQIQYLFQDSSQCGYVVVICPGDSTLINNKYRSTPGIYVDTLIASNLSDSLVFTHLKFDSASYHYQSTSICFGDTARWRGKLFVNAGVYFDTSSGPSICDSIHVFELKIDSLNSGYDTVNICYGDSVLIGGTFQKLSGVYPEVRQGAMCDTIIEVYLNVKLTNPIISVYNNLIYTSYLSGTFQWYDCDNKSIIPGATSSIYAPTKLGNYALIFNDSGCVDTSICVFWNPSGIDDIQDKPFVISPNPSKNYVNIIDLRNEIKTVSLTDLSGKLYFHSTITSKLTIDVQNLTSGIYILKLFGSQNVHSEKLLIE